MKRKKALLKMPYHLVLFISVFLSSCEEVIDFPLRESDKIPVVEAVLDMYTGICEVKVSETQSVTDKSSATMISGLQIKLQYDNKTSAIFKEVQKGVYRSEKIPTASGKSYGLTMNNLNGQTYTANAISPDLVVPNIENIEELDREYSMVSFKWADPVGKENFYWPTLRTKEKSNKSFFSLVSDLGQNGKTFSSYRQFFLTKEIENTQVELLNLDAFSYKYFEQLFNSKFNEDQLPFNPKSNFDKPVAGVFSIMNYKPVKIKLK